MKKRQPLIITTALLAILMVCSLSGWAQLGKIHGTLKNGKEVMPYEKVELWRDGRTTGKGTLTDENGKFEFAMLDAGSYSIKVNTTSGTVVQNVNLESGESEPIICQVSRDEENGPETRVKGLEFLGSSKEVFSVDPKITFTMTDRKSVV